MRFSHFFVDRPIFASVISIILTLVGYISFRALPITEFPEIAPPTVAVNATYAGAVGRCHGAKPLRRRSSRRSTASTT